MLAITWLSLSGLSITQEVSVLNVSEASGFMGEWVIDMETPRGSIEQHIAITDVGGKVAAELTLRRQGTLTITDISRSGTNLHLAFKREMRGNTIPVTLTLRLDGDMLNATMEANNGAFTMSGTGRKK